MLDGGSPGKPAGIRSAQSRWQERRQQEGHDGERGERRGPKRPMVRSGDQRLSQPGKRPGKQERSNRAVTEGER
jgi:hypothetical protein